MPVRPFEASFVCPHAVNKKYGGEYETGKQKEIPRQYIRIMKILFDKECRRYDAGQNMKYGSSHTLLIIGMKNVFDGCECNPLKQNLRDC